MSERRDEILARWNIKQVQAHTGSVAISKECIAEHDRIS